MGDLAETRARLRASQVSKALMINVFSVTIACERDLTPVSRAIFKGLIISDEPVCVLGRAVACPERTDRAAPSASKLSVLPFVYRNCRFGRVTSMTLWS